jgi:hypothetical protein
MTRSLANPRGVICGASFSYFVSAVRRKTRLANNLLATEYYLQNLTNLLVGTEEDKKKNKSIFSYAHE